MTKTKSQKRRAQARRPSQQQQQNARSARPRKAASRSDLASGLGRAFGRGLRGLAGGFTGLPFEVSGANAVATPSRTLGPVQVSAPAANGLVTTTTNATMTMNKTGNMNIRHREYITDVIPAAGAAGQFQLLYNHSVNPGNPLMFPWLSDIAARFESYVFRGLRFVYEPQCATTSTGTVMMVIDYDAADEPPISKTQMMAYKGAVRSPPWFCASNVSNLTELRKRATYYVRNGAQEGTQDPRLYDVGRFFLAYEGPTLSSSFYAGELYVEYDVELMTPVLEPYTLSGTTAAGPGASLTNQTFANSANQTLFGTNPPVVTYSASYANAFIVGVNIPGLYLLSIYLVSSTTTTAAISLAAAAITGSNALVGDMSTAIIPTATANPNIAGFVPIEFPNNTDYVQVYLNGMGLSALTLTQITFVLTPISQSTLNFPPIVGAGTSNLARVKRDMENLSRLIKGLELSGHQVHGGLIKSLEQGADFNCGNKKICSVEDQYPEVIRGNNVGVGADRRSAVKQRQSLKDASDAVTTNLVDVEDLDHLMQQAHQTYHAALRARIPVKSIKLTRPPESASGKDAEADVAIDG